MSHDLIEIIQEGIKSLKNVKGGSFQPVVLPNGELTDKVTPEVKRIHDYHAEKTALAILPLRRKLLSSLDNYRVKKGPKAFDNLAEQIISLREFVVVDEDGTIWREVSEGKVDESGKIVPITRIVNDPQHAKTYNSVIDGRLKEMDIRRSILVCPTVFCHEPGDIDTNSLKKLLDPQRFKRAGYRPGDFRSSNIRLKTKGIPGHSVKASVYLSEQNGEFSIALKYMNFGMKSSEDKTDKLDIVYALSDSQRQGDIYHLEIQVPHQLEKTVERDRVLEENGSFKDSDNHLIRVRGATGFEYKRDGQTGDYFGFSFENDPKRFESPLKTDLRNYSDLIEDPSLIGGHPFGEAVAFIKDHFEDFKNLYRTLSEEKEEK